jgi:hypothetical protein
MTNGSTGGTGGNTPFSQSALVEALRKVIREELSGAAKKLGVPKGKKESKALGQELGKDFIGAMDGVLGFGLQAMFAKRITKLSESYYDNFIKPVEKANSELAKTFTTVAAARASLALGESLSPMAMQASHLATQFEDLGQKILSNAGNLHDFNNSLRFVKKGMAGKIQIMDLGAKAAAALEDSLLPLTLANKKVGGTAAFNTEMLLKLQQAYKLSAEDLGKIGTRAVGMGKTVSSVLLSGEKAARKYAKAFGLNTNTVIKDIGKLMTDFETFGHRSSEELANVSAAARVLGTSLDAVKKMEIYDDFDQAAMAASKASQYFGMMIDPMELFLANDEDRLKIIKERADLAGVDLASMDRRDRKAFSKVLGVSMKDLVPLLSKQNMGADKAAAGAVAAGTPMTMQEETQAVEKELKALTAAFKEGPEAFSKFTSGLADLIPKAEQTFREQTLRPLTDAFFGDTKTLQSFTKTLTDPSTGALATFGSLSKALAMSDFPAKEKLVRASAESLGKSLKRLSTTSDELQMGMKKFAKSMALADPKDPLAERQSDAFKAASGNFRQAAQDLQDFTTTLGKEVRTNISKTIAEIAGLSGTTIKGAGKLAAETLAALEALTKKVAAGMIGTAAGVSDLKSILGGAIEELEKQKVFPKGTTKDLKGAGLISARTPDAPKIDPLTRPAGRQIPQDNVYAVAYNQDLNDKLELITGMVEARQNIHLTINQQTSLDKATVLQAVLDAPVTPGGDKFRRRLSDITGNTV